ncbi:diadenylate cyclase CdaA [Clostridium oceanicum]|uniref:Diadenylate cyclase n=1 Tax=Clostridium oceanicum TaxID=1543 RepID=A0ABN1JAV5_9CLOT
MEFLQVLSNSIKNMSMFSVLDILVVSYIFYKSYMLIRETRAEQLLKGIILIVVLIPISSLLKLTMLSWILQKTITIGVLSFVIIFQPEIRRALEHIGRSAFNEKQILRDEEKMEDVVGNIVTAVDNLSKDKVGALIIVEQFTGLGEVISTGTKLDAEISSALLENIFVVNTPLHDGATIIRNDRIISAGCFLPLTQNKHINKKLGTRHRAAIGISENSDCITIIVSEETGIVSLAVNGQLTRGYDKQKLKDILIKIIKKSYTREVTFKGKVVEWVEKIKTKI